MRLVQFSAAQGPSECALATEKAFQYFLQDLHQKKIKYEILEIVEVQFGIKSALIKVDLTLAELHSQRWIGSHLWVCQSPIRPHHKRKNWFFGVQSFSLPEKIPESDITFTAIRAQGPGGQHVNKTASAIQAVHVATGISVKIQTERSQQANRKLARLLIEHQLSLLQADARNDVEKARRYAHHQVLRGDPVRIFVGDDFIERKAFK